MIRLSFIPAFFLNSLLSAQTIAPVTIEPASPPGFQEVSWPAYQGRTYYLQTSPDLINWTVNPSYVIGDDMLHGMVIGGVTPLFARVLSFQGLPTDDNDGDGLTNHHEITSSLTNPDTADSDGDGASDGEESAAQTDPNDPDSGPAFVVEITMPPGANTLQIFLDEHFIFLGDNSALVSPLPGTVTTTAPQTPGNWHVEFWDTAITRTAIVDFRRFQPSPSPRRLNLLNVREIWPTDEVEADALTLEIPANQPQATFETAWNDPLPTHGGYGTWKLLPVMVVELAPLVRNESGDDVPTSRLPEAGDKLTPFVEINPHTNRIAHRELNVKIGDASLAGREVTWTLGAVPGAIPAIIRGEWQDSPTHSDRFEASTAFGANDFNRLAQTSGETTITGGGFTAVRVNVPPIGFNQVRVTIQIEDIDDPIDLIDMEVPGVVIVDAGHGGIDPGAIGVTDDMIQVEEADLALSYSLQLRDELIAKFEEEFRNLRVILTRADDSSLPLSARAPFARREGADVFVSIHFNSAAVTTARGSETFVERTAAQTAADRVRPADEGGDPGALGANINQEEDALLAQELQQAMVNAILTVDPGGAHRQTFENNNVPLDGTPIPGVKRAGKAVTRDGATRNGNVAGYHPVRSCLLEVEFLANPTALNSVNIANNSGLTIRNEFSERVSSEIFDNMINHE